LARRQQKVLKWWLRHAKNFIDEGKIFGRGLVDFQVGNEKGSIDLVKCQEGKGEKMGSA
jgi:hypothetical protein